MPNDHENTIRGIATEAFLDGYRQAVNDIIHVFLPMLDGVSEKDHDKIKMQLSMAFDHSFQAYVRRENP